MKLKQRLGMNPKWTHHCEDCKYLGSMHLRDDTADWYECGESVLARLSGEGSDYWSMPTGMVTNDAYLISRERDGTYDGYGYTSMIVLARFMLSRKEQTNDD